MEDEGWLEVEDKPESETEDAQDVDYEVMKISFFSDQSQLSAG